MTSRKIINFAAGPAKLPEEVMKQAQAEFVNYENTGVSVMELSHRGGDFTKIINAAENNLRELLHVPDNYKVLFMQGGGTGLMAAVPLNLLGLNDSKTADYFVTGTWSSKAAKEAEKYCKVNLVLPKTNVYTGVPCKSKWNPLNPNAAYVYYCCNETIHGVEFPEVPDTNGVPLVCDMSSNIMSKPVDVSKFAVILAGAQKNIGPAGVTIVIVRDDVLGHALPITPTILDFKIMAGNNSCYNTPPTYSIYMTGLVFEWLKKNGGVAAMQERSERKSSAVYEAIDSSNGFYYCPISVESRSRMNLPLRIRGPDGDEALEKQFIDEAAKMGMIQLKGHRSVGGIRVSLYNAITVEETYSIVEYMKNFQMRHQ